MTKYGCNVYFNGNVRSSFINGYRTGDPLVMSRVVIFPVGENPEAACAQVWRILNADERPNAGSERSLSMGDVIKIVCPPNEETGEISNLFFAIEKIGFREISAPEGI